MENNALIRANTIRIIVEGPNKGGKSTIAQIIARQLTVGGLAVAHQDQDGGKPLTGLELLNRLGALIDRGTTVEIVEQSVRAWPTNEQRQQAEAG